MADGPFDAMFKAANGMFLDVFGADGGLTYQPNATGSGRAIRAIRVDEKPLPRPGTSNNNEFEEWRWKISSANDTEGVTQVQVLGFKGQVGDRVLNLNGKTWFVVYVDAGCDPGMQIITLRDKGIPMEQEIE